VRFDLLKILLVDDNQHMRMLLTEILRALGVRQIFEALDGAEALQLMREVEMDLVMTDLTMGPWTASTSSTCCATRPTAPPRSCRSS
jgi:two-component system chemotaxis response regulator CheY